MEFNDASRVASLDFDVAELALSKIPNLVCPPIFIVLRYCDRAASRLLRTTVLAVAKIFRLFPATVAVAIQVVACISQALLRCRAVRVTNHEARVPVFVHAVQARGYRVIVPVLSQYQSTKKAGDCYFHIYF